jgi:outer membrane protein TolC
MKIHQPVALALTLLAVSCVMGCAVLTPTDAYRAIAPRYSIPGVSPTLSANLRSSQAAGEITLDLAVELAVANNPELAAAGFDAEAAKARKDAARGALLPRISAEGGYTRYLDDQRLIPARFNGEPGVFGDDIFSGDVVVRMPLFTGGKLLNEMRAADLLRQSAEQRMVRTREELVFNVSSVFFGILAQEHIVKSLEFSKEALEAHLKRVNDLIAAQKAAKVDRLRTEVRLSDVEQKLVREKNALAIQHRLMANLIGVEEPATSLRLVGTLEQTMPDLQPPADCVSAAFARRPDYLAARKELEAQARRVDVARAGHSPTVSLLGSYGERWAVNPNREPTGTKDAEDVGRIGIGVELPLFESGRTQARVREERAKLAASQERFRKLGLQIRLEVETVLSNVTSAFERMQTTEKAIELARETLRIEREKYELAKGTILDVLDAQATLLETETNFYQALADFNTAKAQVQLTMGEM